MAKMTRKQLDQIGHSLAYESAASSIECCTFKGTDGSGDWMVLDSDPKDPALGSDAATVRLDFEYLEARGLIERHPGHATWLRVADESEATR